MDVLASNFAESVEALKCTVSVDELALEDRTPGGVKSCLRKALELVPPKIEVERARTREDGESSLQDFGAAVEASGKRVADSLQELLGHKKDAVHVCLEKELRHAGLYGFFAPETWPAGTAVHHIAAACGLTSCFIVSSAGL